MKPYRRSRKLLVDCSARWLRAGSNTGGEVVVLDLKMVPVGNAIVIPRVEELFDDRGRLLSVDILGDRVDALLDELARLTNALAAVRDAAATAC